MNHKHTLFLVFVVVNLVLAGCASTPVPISQLRIGDYVQFGSYAGKPILWRVIADSANPDATVNEPVTGDPLLLSDKIIIKKPFDAPRSGGKGSNEWRTSTLRAWLNSSAEAGGVTWPGGNPPLDDQGEKGFLADGNFTASERNLIKPVTQKTVVYPGQSTEGGSEAYDYGRMVTSIVNNYDNAYYQILTDQVFPLDPKQLDHLVQNILGYYDRAGGEYWLRAPDQPDYQDSSASNVLTAGYVSDGRERGLVMYKSASRYDIGVRPALALNRETVLLARGSGERIAPFVVTPK